MVTRNSFELLLTHDHHHPVLAPTTTSCCIRYPDCDEVLEDVEVLVSGTWVFERNNATWVESSLYGSYKVFPPMPIIPLCSDNSSFTTHQCLARVLDSLEWVGLWGDREESRRNPLPIFSTQPSTPESEEPWLINVKQNPWKRLLKWELFVSTRTNNSKLTWLLAIISKLRLDNLF